MAVQYEPIRPIKTVRGGDAFPAMSHFAEKSSQTHQNGVPVRLNSGYLQEADFSAADIIYGFALEEGHNLTADGTAQELSEGTPPNQPSAVKTPVGARVRDGNIDVAHADSATIFSVMLFAGQVFTQALIVDPATLYGLTKDATSGFWYLDSTDTSGNNAVAQILELDDASPNSATNGARVFIQIDAAKRFFA